MALAALWMALLSSRISPLKTKEAVNKKGPIGAFFFLYLAERTGLEPATLGVTGRYSNQLNYRSSFNAWRPQGDSNPCTHRERVMS